jgi:DNA-binding NarL/FixJ family response regulator
MNIRVTIADDHSEIRRILRNVIESQPDMKIIGEAGNGKDAVERCLSLVPDIAIVDVHMPDLNGIEAARQIASQLPQVKILALSGDPDPHYIKGMLMAGASGYVLKDCIFDELVNAIRKIVKGETHLSATIKREIFSAFCDSIEHLTDIEEAVLHGLAEGKCISDIASDLHLDPEMVYETSHAMVKNYAASEVGDLAEYIIREEANFI